MTRNLFLPRILSLFLSLILSLPSPAFALRIRSGGLEEETDVTRQLEAHLKSGLEEGEGAQAESRKVWRRDLIGPGIVLGATTLTGRFLAPTLYDQATGSLEKLQNRKPVIPEKSLGGKALSGPLTRESIAEMIDGKVLVQSNAVFPVGRPLTKSSRYTAVTIPVTLEKKGEAYDLLALRFKATNVSLLEVTLTLKDSQGELRKHKYLLWQEDWLHSNVDPDTKVAFLRVFGFPEEEHPYDRCTLSVSAFSEDVLKEWSLRPDRLFAYRTGDYQKSVEERLADLGARGKSGWAGAALGLAAGTAWVKYAYRQADAQDAKEEEMFQLVQKALRYFSRNYGSQRLVRYQELPDGPILVGELRRIRIDAGRLLDDPKKGPDDLALFLHRLAHASYEGKTLHNKSPQMRLAVLLDEGLLLRFAAAFSGAASFSTASGLEEGLLGRLVRHLEQELSFHSRKLLTYSLQEDATRYMLIIPPRGYGRTLDEIVGLLYVHREVDSAAAISLWRGGKVDRVPIQIPLESSSEELGRALHLFVQDTSLSLNGRVAEIFDTARAASILGATAVIQEQWNKMWADITPDAKDRAVILNKMVEKWRLYFAGLEEIVQEVERGLQGAFEQFKEGQEDGAFDLLLERFPKWVEEVRRLREKRFDGENPIAVSLKGFFDRLDAESQRNFTVMLATFFITKSDRTIVKRKAAEAFIEADTTRIVSGEDDLFHIIGALTAPALDVGIQEVLEDWEDGKVFVVAGGGATNMGWAVHVMWGAPLSLALILHGAIGGYYQNALMDAGLPLDEVSLDRKANKQTRAAIGISKKDKAYNLTPKGTPLSLEEGEELKGRVKRIVKKFEGRAVVVFSGSLAPGLAEDYAKQFGIEVQKEGGKFILDTKGMPLKLALFSDVPCCFMVTPTAEEFLEALEIQRELREGISADPEQLIRLAWEVVQRGGVEHVVLTRNKDGAILVGRDVAYVASGPEVVEVDALGAGDTLTGKMAFHLRHGSPLEGALWDAVRWASTSVAVHGPGGGTMDMAMRLSNRMRVQPFTLARDPKTQQLTISPITEERQGDLHTGLEEEKLLAGPKTANFLIGPIGSFVDALLYGSSAAPEHMALRAAELRGEMSWENRLNATFTRDGGSSYTQTYELVGESEDELIGRLPSEILQDELGIKIYGSNETWYVKAGLMARESEGPSITITLVQTSPVNPQRAKAILRDLTQTMEGMTHVLLRSVPGSPESEMVKPFDPEELRVGIGPILARWPSSAQLSISRHPQEPTWLVVEPVPDTAGLEEGGADEIPGSDGREDLQKARSYLWEGKLRLAWDHWAKASRLTRSSDPLFFNVLSLALDLMAEEQEERQLSLEEKIPWFFGQMEALGASQDVMDHLSFALKEAARETVFPEGGLDFDGLFVEGTSQWAPDRLIAHLEPGQPSVAVSVLNRPPLRKIFRHWSLELQSSLSEAGMILDLREPAASKKMLRKEAGENDVILLASDAEVFAWVPRDLKTPILVLPRPTAAQLTAQELAALAAVAKGHGGILRIREITRAGLEEPLLIIRTAA